jgi:ABC-type phosphate transport system substrate-binding protein
MEVYRDMNSITTSIMRARYSIGFNILSYVDNVFLSSKGLERTVETTARVHLRWEPDRESASQCVIPADTVVPYLGDTVLDDRDVAWYEVRYEDFSGYVCSKYAKLHVDETSLKLFAIDGYEPNTENFRTGKYPYVTTSYVAIRADEPADSPARRLFDWVGSEESEKIIQENSTLSVNALPPVLISWIRSVK